MSMVTLDDYSGEKKKSKPKKIEPKIEPEPFIRKSMDELRPLDPDEILSYLNEAHGHISKEVPEKEYDQIEEMCHALEFRKHNMRMGHVEVTKLFDGTIIATGDFAHCIRENTIGKPNKVKNLLHNIEVIYRHISKKKKWRGIVSTYGGNRFGWHEEGFKKSDQFKEIERNLNYNKSNHKDEPTYHYHHYIVTEEDGKIQLTYTDMNEFIFGITEVWQN